MTLMIDLPFTGLAPWVDYFKDVELPVLRHTVQQLDELREQADRINARKLAGVIMQDPLMTLRVFRYIAEHRSQRQLNDITTVEQALMMIGIHPFFEKFQNLPIIEQQLKGYPKALLGLLRVISRARHAAHWAHDWAVFRGIISMDEIAVAALLHDLAEIIMWCFAPTLGLRVKERQLADPTLRSSEVQAQVLGIPLHQLKLELAKAWALPQLLVALMDPANANSPDVRNVKLAVDLARHTANGWDDPALPDDFTAIEALLHIGHRHLLERVGAPEELVLAALALETLEATLGS
jgi:HD-like signal output (HDOD) protein